MYIFLQAGEQVVVLKPGDPVTAVVPHDITAKMDNVDIDVNITGKP